MLASTCMLKEVKKTMLFQTTDFYIKQVQTSEGERICSVLRALSSKVMYPLCTTMKLSSHTLLNWSLSLLPAPEQAKKHGRKNGSYNVLFYTQEERKIQKSVL